VAEAMVEALSAGKVGVEDVGGVILLVGGEQQMR